MVDVQNKKCIFDNCIAIPYYNYKNNLKEIQCKKHKLDGMIDVKIKRNVNLNNNS